MTIGYKNPKFIISQTQTEGHNFFAKRQWPFRPEVKIALPVLGEIRIEASPIENLAL
jgi:hypothetical protein